MSYIVFRWVNLPDHTEYWSRKLCRETLSDFWFWIKCKNLKFHRIFVFNYRYKKWRNNCSLLLEKVSNEPPFCNVYGLKIKGKHISEEPIESKDNIEATIKRPNEQ